ncbi:hypothetical protein [uncultured Aquimarina sp.]|uniref:tetratricopeptide repeat protein n=1 Tax=uncultured Aquimarina sp. TaxID=575652 RepID=UPI00261C8580|nr:hypothetical protein [uncultured Aquimarina sp.]
MNRKNIFRFIILILGLFFVVKKIYNSAEYSNIKKINKSYYSGEFIKAKSELELHLKEYPKSSESWAYLGLVNLELDDTINAELAYKKSYQLDKKNDKTLIGLGIVNRMKKNYDSARFYYNKAIKFNANNPDVYSSLLILELKNKNYNKAVELGEKAWAMKNKNTRPGVLGNLIIAYHYNNQLERRDEALIELENLNYKDIEYIKMAINGKVDLIDFL